MIARIVLLKLKPEFGGAEALKEIVAESQASLSSLPGVVSAEVGWPADARAASDWDLTFLLRFETIADVEPYRHHPDHRAFVDGYLKPKLSAIKAWNFVLRS
ncbi:MAG: Dabb family protein [Deltaproteobacteria bacterium]|nr:Dabb family protein [Deltaproteobacteria bacterium]